MSVNKVIILGNLGQDPEVQITQSGKHVAKLSIATSEKFKKQDGTMQEKTEWHRVILWNKQAELAGKYLRKGRKVYIEGKIQTRSWDDQSGQKRYTTEIVGNQLVFIDSTRGDGGGQETQQHPSNPGSYYGQPQNQGQQQSPQNLDFPEDDVPF